MSDDDKATGFTELPDLPLGLTLRQHVHNYLVGLNLVIERLEQGDTDAHRVAAKQSRGIRTDLVNTLAFHDRELFMTTSSDAMKLAATDAGKLQVQMSRGGVIVGVVEVDTDQSEKLGHAFTRFASGDWHPKGDG